MIEQIYAILDGDTALKGLVSRIEPKGETDYTEDCALYEYTETGDDGAVMTARLQITAICSKQLKALAVLKRVRQLLVTNGDEELTPTIMRVIANGGGHLYDSARKKHHQIIYFNITGRSDSNGS